MSTRNIFILLVFILIISSCQLSTKKMSSYNKIKKELKVEIFDVFENYLPAPYEKSETSLIRFSPAFNAFGLSGIDVLYNFKETNEFNISLSILSKDNKFNTKVLYNFLDFSTPQSESIKYKFKGDKIVIPNVKFDFCTVKETCLTWDDLEVILLDYGKGVLFTKSADPVSNLYEVECSYTIGSLISREKVQIIYWVFIYK